MRYAITYVSTAAPELSGSRVEEVLEFSKNWNNSHDITGLLLYSDGNFLQILEGERKIVQDLFENIKKDNRHKNVIKIFEKQISIESFETYECKFVSENTKYNQLKTAKYFEHIKSLDPDTQKAVKSILGLFLNSN